MHDLREVLASVARSFRQARGYRGKAETTDTTLPVGAVVTDDAHRAHLRCAVAASTVGATIEWYDFLIYSTMTGLVFGKVFFAGSDQHA